ncbi:MAG: hypothetical protein WA869_08845, partial [Alloacidobacterium sp.]
VTNPHVNLCAVPFPGMKRCAGFESELRHSVCLNTQQISDPTVKQCPGMAKDIHQQGVGTVRAIQLHPSPICQAS